MIKPFIKRILPKKILTYIQNYKFNYRIKKAYKYDAQFYIASSDKNKSPSSTTLIGKIIREYHVIEKGLTMPKRRLGFGTKVISSLCDNCIEFITKHNSTNCQLNHAMGVLLEYKKLHEETNFKLSKDINIKLQTIDNLKIATSTEQKTTTRENYFSKTKSDFKSFSNSRKSIRNYSEVSIPTERIHKALQLATNTPSACNRQAWRTYLYSDKKKIQSILDIQGGNRGFGHLADKLIIITSEIGMFYTHAERNQAFIDGGIYAMNLLYTLHYYEIGACILNCSVTPEKDIKLREATAVKPSEVFIAMISCGNLPDEFSYPISKRYSIDITHKDI